MKLQTLANGHLFLQRLLATGIENRIRNDASSYEQNSTNAVLPHVMQTNQRISSSPTKLSRTRSTSAQLQDKITHRDSGLAATVFSCECCIKRNHQAMTKTLILVILDESGSMESSKSDIIQGFTSFIQEQKNIKNDAARLYLVKFSNGSVFVHMGVQLEHVPVLNDYNYCPNGSTALYDAIADGVEVADQQKTPEERVICVIMTDGDENASKRTSEQRVKDIISGHQARGDWTFLYIGPGADEWAKRFGISTSLAIDYNFQAPAMNFSNFNVAVSNFRSSSARQRNDLFKRS